MAQPFHYESQQPETSTEKPMKIGAAMQEVFAILADNHVGQPIRDYLCTRNDAVAISTAGIKRDYAMENAYSDYQSA